MCGRYKDNEQSWAELHGILAGFTSPPPLSYERPEVRPTNSCGIVTPCLDGGYRRIEARWGLIPHWHKMGIKDWKATSFNAKIEEAAVKPSFRTAWKFKHCLVPAAGFWEWAGEHPTDPKKKQRHWITRGDNNPMIMAGLYDTAMTTDGEVTSFTVLTRGAGRDMLDLHHREPVFLHPDQLKRWLDLEPMQDLVNPTQAGTLRHVPERGFA